MKRLLFVRHGETHMNVTGQLSGRIETPLTQKGIDQARVAGQQLAEMLPRIDLIVCSPLARAVDTAVIIAREVGFPVASIQKNELFTERSYGTLEGTIGKDFLASHSYRDFDSVAGVETIKALQERAEAAFTFLQSCSQENILVIGHGAFARAIMRVAKGLPYTHEYEVDASIGNAAIVELV